MDSQGRLALWLRSNLFGLPRYQSPISNCIRGSNYCQQVLPIRLRGHGYTGLFMPRQ